jgi:putative DNA primase/helicase
MRAPEETTDTAREQILMALEMRGVWAIYEPDMLRRFLRLSREDRPSGHEVVADLRRRDMQDEEIIKLYGIAREAEKIETQRANGARDDIEHLITGDETAEKELSARANGAQVGRNIDERLKPYDLSEFLNLEIPPREHLLAPIIREKGAGMLYGPRGVGKTFIMQGINVAVASGGTFLKWQAPKPRRVLCIDGEMPASELQDRLNWTIAGSKTKPEPSMLQILPADLIESGVGNLADQKVQAALDPWLEGVSLLSLDNLSTLTAVIRDNDAESWSPIQDYILRLRRRGISVLMGHHAGKGGQQRGTSRREDILDTSISLRRPSGYVSTEGARFEVHIEKGRGLHGDELKPFEARLEVREGVATWTTREVEDENSARVAAMLDDGMSIRDIADETGIKKSTVHNIKKRLDTEKAGASNVSCPNGWTAKT